MRNLALVVVGALCSQTAGASPCAPTARGCWTPTHAAQSVPKEELRLHLEGGLSLIDLDVPTVPAAYAMTGDIGVAYGLADWLDLRARYSTVLGLIHRIGPELRARVLDAGAVSGALRLHPSVQFAGAYEEDLDYGGDVSTLTSALLTYYGDTGAITVEAGATVQWLLFENLRGKSFADDVPYLAYVEFALGYEWTSAPGESLDLRLELSVPTAPDDPFTVLGVLPRALFGGSWVL